MSKRYVIMEHFRVNTNWDSIEEKWFVPVEAIENYLETNDTKVIKKFLEEEYTNSDFNNLEVICFELNLEMFKVSDLEKLEEVVTVLVALQNLIYTSGKDILNNEIFDDFEEAIADLENMGWG